MMTLVKVLVVLWGTAAILFPLLELWEGWHDVSWGRMGDPSPHSSLCSIGRRGEQIVSTSRPCDHCMKGVKVGKRGTRAVRCEMCVDRDGKPVYLCTLCRKELGYQTATQKRSARAIRKVDTQEDHP